MIEKVVDVSMANDWCLWKTKTYLAEHRWKEYNEVYNETNHINSVDGIHRYNAIDNDSFSIHDKKEKVLSDFDLQWQGNGLVEYRFYKQMLPFVIDA